MKKLPFALAIIFCVAFLSCKKKEADPEPAPDPTPTTPTIAYNGLFLLYETVSVNSGTISSSYGQNYAYFLTEGFTAAGDGYGDLVNTGTVSLNAIRLKENGSSYSDTTFTIFNSPLALSVSGGNGFPAFTYTYTNARPNYTGWSALQDTIKLNQNTVINLIGITGADKISIDILDANSGNVSKVIPGTSTSVSFTPSELSSITTSTSSTLYIRCSKSSIVGIGGKNFNFEVNYFLNKSIVTK